MRIVFLGSDTAISVLKSLCNSKHEVVAVVCQPDKPNGRNNKIEMCEVKKFADSKNIPVLQYEKVSKEGVQDIKNFKPDFLISAAYGQLISQEIIDIPKYETLNIHPSLLPKYRGASPIMSAILNGDKETGVAIMKMVLKMDAGATYVVEKVKINENETAGELTERLFNLGSQLLLETIEKIVSGKAVLTEQNEEKVTFCSKIMKEDAKLNFEFDCEKLFDMTRAYNPSPVAYFQYNNENYKVFESKYALQFSEEYMKICSFLKNNEFKNGEIVYSLCKPFGLVIKAKNGFFMPTVIQAPNGKKMDIKSYLNGKSFNVGEILNWKNVC